MSDEKTGGFGRVIEMGLLLGASPIELGLPFDVPPYLRPILESQTPLVVDKRPRRMLILSTPLTRDPSPFRQMYFDEVDK